MKYFVLTLFLLGVAILATSADPVQPAHEEPPVEEYDVAIEDEYVEEPTTTARPARRSRPAARREKTTKSEPTTTTVAPTEKSTKRTRTTTGSSASRTTTTKASGDAAEAVTSTYRRPKFPPRKLPGPTRKPSPPPEEIVDDPANLPADETLPAEGEANPDAPVEEEFIEEVR